MAAKTPAVYVLTVIDFGDRITIQVQDAQNGKSKTFERKYGDHLEEVVVGKGKKATVKQEMRSYPGQGETYGDIFANVRDEFDQLK